MEVHISFTCMAKLRFEQLARSLCNFNLREDILKIQDSLDAGCSSESS
jgi:hypothetical protein